MLEKSKNNFFLQKKKKELKGKSFWTFIIARGNFGNKRFFFWSAKFTF